MEIQKLTLVDSHLHPDMTQQLYPNPKVGVKLGFRWTPTDLGETADEWVCASLACDVTGTNTHYAQQVEFSGAVSLRF